MVKKTLSCFLLISFILSSVLATGQTTVNFPFTGYTLNTNSTKDANLNAGSVATNNGTSTTMVIRDRNNSARQRSVVEFDISSIPSGAIITSATLTLRSAADGQRGDNNTSVSVHPITNVWTEAGVTWNSRVSGTAWSAAGGDYNTGISATATVGTANNTDFTWTVTDIVQDWVNGTYTNNGFLVKFTSENNNNNNNNINRTFHTEEATTVSNRPTLNITYIIPTTLSTNSTKDAYIDQNDAGANYGSVTPLQVGVTRSWSWSSYTYTYNPKRALLDFDLSSIPDGATITSAKLKLTTASGSSTGTNEQINVHLITTDWQANSVNWNSTISYSNTPTSNTTVGTGNPLNIEWDVQSLLQEYINNKNNYYGFLLKLNNESQTTRNRNFHSEEATTASNRPTLDITYTPLPIILISRCQGIDSAFYQTTGTDITYSLDVNSLWAGNSIDPATGKVVWAKNWIGESTITASNGNSVKVVTKGTITTPIFNLGSQVYRSKGVSTATYDAYALYADNLTYSLDPLSAGTINTTTGAVTWDASFEGTATITATATGCGGPKDSSLTVITTSSLQTVNDIINVYQGATENIDVSSNDILGIYDLSTLNLTIVEEPLKGTASVSSDKKITYIQDGASLGTDTITYALCNADASVCSQAEVIINIKQNAFDACLNANKSKTYFLPFPENATQLRKSLLSAGSQTSSSNNVRSVTSIKITYPGTVIVYDHWEDGYETNIKEPSQRTTLVWGDGNSANGVAPGYPNDIIPPGGFIVLDNEFSFNDRDQSIIAFDGKDKIYSTTELVLSKVAGFVDRFTVQTVKTNIYDIDVYGDYYIVPFGENITGDAGNVFRYTGLFMQAKQDGTLVKLDYDGDGIFDVERILNEGEVWLYDGTASTPGVAGNVDQANDIQAGAIISSNNPIGVDVVFGGIDSYGTRNMPLLPREFNGSVYYSPVHTTNSGYPVYAFFTNPSDDDVIVDWTTGIPSSGSVTIPAKSYNSLSLSAQSGYKFASRNGETFTAAVVIDAQTTGTAYDWAFPCIPENQLTPHIGVAWAPGSVDKSENVAPIWITSPDTITIYVKWDGNIMGEYDNISPCGLPYDVTYTINPLQVLKLYNPNQNDQSGLTIYSCNKDGEQYDRIVAVWGQDAGVAGTSGTGSIDAGYTLMPRCFKEMVLANDDIVKTEPDTPIDIAVLSNDAAFLCTIDKLTLTTDGLISPSNGTIVMNPDKTITYTPEIGFVGTDYFEYRICSYEYPAICDVAQVTVSILPCYAEDNQNLVRGRVYVDKFPHNGTFETGEIGAIGVRVNLYNDDDCDGVIDSEDRIVQTTTTELSGNFSFITNNGQSVRDNFDVVGTLNGNNGSKDWTTAWSRSSTTNVTIATDANGYSSAMRITSNPNASRNVTFSNATSGILKLKFRRQSVPAGGGVEVRFNGNVVFNITTSAAQTDAIYTDVFIILDGSKINGNGSNTLLFQANGSLGSGIYWIDDVEVIYFSNSSCFITKAEPVGGYDPLAVTTAPVVFSSIGDCGARVFIPVKANMFPSNDTVMISANKTSLSVDVLANDTTGHPDVTTVTIVSGPTHGTASVTAEGFINYDPSDVDDLKRDSLTYQVCSKGDPTVCNTAKLHIFPFTTTNTPICEAETAKFFLTSTRGDTILLYP